MAGRDVLDHLNSGQASALTGAIWQAGMAGGSRRLPYPVCHEWHTCREGAKGSLTYETPGRIPLIHIHSWGVHVDKCLPEFDTKTKLNVKYDEFCCYLLTLFVPISWTLNNNFNKKYTLRMIWSILGNPPMMASRACLSAKNHLGAL